MSSNILLVTDIFGNCTALQPLLQDIAAAGTTVTIIDPYQGKLQCFADEAEAYQVYSSQCGHDAYAAFVEQALAQAHRIVEALAARALPVVALTDRLTSPLARSADAVVTVPEVDFGAFRSLSATITLALTLAVAVGAARG